MRTAWPFLLCLLPGLAAAQTSLSGMVRDSVTRQPLPFASVFLVNTTLGATTNEQGRYVLPAVPAGRHEVAATYLGHRLRQQSVVVGSAPLTIDLALPPAAQALGEVVVRPHPAIAADYQRFLELFLGTSSFARQCQVRNPTAVQVDYDPAARALTAEAARQPLLVDNLALGYRLTFYNLHFRADFADQSATLTTLSQVVFKELTGTGKQQKWWAANRQRAYQGSFMHFLRSAYVGDVVQQGFRLQRLQRLPNRRWAAADSLVHARQAAGEILNQNSLPPSVWQHLAEPHIISILYTAYLPPDSVRRAEADGRVWLRFRDLLAVTYDGERPDPNFRLPGAVLGRSLPRYQESVLHLQPPPAAEIEPNGVPAEPLALLTEGYWSFEKIGELLPLDYLPPTFPTP